MLAHLKSCGFGGVPLTVGRYSREISILYSHENYPQAGVSTYFTMLCVPVHQFEKLVVHCALFFSATEDDWMSQLTSCTYYICMAFIECASFCVLSDD